MAATDDFATYRTGLDSPARHAAIVSPSDSADLTHVTRGLFIGATGGALKVTTVGGETLVFPDLPANSIIPLQVTRVWLTSQVATPIVALW